MAQFSLDQLRDHSSKALSSLHDYSPFIYGVGKRAIVGGAWGAAFGIIFFRKSSHMRKFSTLYGVGFGLGMCAPTISQLAQEFSKNDPAVSERKSAGRVTLKESKVLSEIESLKQEVVLRS